MDILLTHTTALEALRRWGARARPCRDVSVPPGVPAAPELEGALGALGLPLPAELLVSEERGRVRSRLVDARVSSEPLPQGSVLRLRPGLRCVSAEHVAVQLARFLTDLELTCLISELVGTYAVVPGTERGMFQRSEPLTTPERIRAHLAALGPRSGAARVGRCLARACVGLASPRETKLSLRIGLAPALGGYHLPVLSMNEPLEVRRVNDLLGSHVRRPDILLLAPRAPESGGAALSGVAVEYDGSDHYGAARHAEDADRHNELTALGLKEYVVGRAQYRDLAYMDGLAGLIRRDLGMARLGLTDAEAARRRDLRQRLFEELELIDGVHWDGRSRERAASVASLEPGSAGWDVVPVEAYGLA